MYVLLALLGSGGSVLFASSCSAACLLYMQNHGLLVGAAATAAIGYQHVACGVVIASYCQASVSFGATQLMAITLFSTPLFAGLSL